MYALHSNITLSPTAIPYSSQIPLPVQYFMFFVFNKRTSGETHQNKCVYWCHDTLIFSDPRRGVFAVPGLGAESALFIRSGFRGSTRDSWRGILGARRERRRVWSNLWMLKWLEGAIGGDWVGSRNWNTPRIEIVRGPHCPSFGRIRGTGILVNCKFIRSLTKQLSLSDCTEQSSTKRWF